MDDLYIVRDLNDPYAILTVEDPVRPEILPEDRISENKEVILLLDENKTPAAIVCVSYQDQVPIDTDQLIESDTPSIAVFYTIWSYVPGAGKKLLEKAKDYIKHNRPHIQRFVTLSPKTELAEKFHLGNGAVILNKNENSVNYEYL